MINFFRRLFGRGAKTETNEFYRFVTDASSGEKKKILKQVIRQADEDQLNLVKRYEQRFGTAHKSTAQ